MKRASVIAVTENGEFGRPVKQAGAKREAAQEQVMQDGSGQDGNDMPMV